MEEEPLNLKRYHGDTTLAAGGDEAEQLQTARNNNYQSDDVSRFFDSRDYRCCFNIFHAKIGTFIFCTLVFHEIVLGGLYLTTKFLPLFPKCPIYAIMAMVCRFIQLPTVVVLYLGLWQHKPNYLIPFAISQTVCGTFADLSTLYTMIDDLSAAKSKVLLFDDMVANLLVMATLYVVILIALLWVVRRCRIYFQARQKHEEQRRRVKEEERAAVSAARAALNGNESLI
ncbi:hypothetical protein L596_004971 [Steinernema carpocapsae]|nr:hypothetical protein L596_004971 [Steinernema carpocapsae]